MEKEYVISSPMKTVIKLDDHFLTITRKGLMSALNQGSKGDKTIALKSITAVQLKKPSMLTNGYIQFTISGGTESRGGLFKATQDENSIMFTKKNYEEMLELKKSIESYHVEERQEKVTTVSAAKSPVEQVKELKELLDMEIITQAEFDTKKKELLGL